ncbi:MAG TPA: Zn-binding domain-containing protein, partial [Chloroflexota bacterium]
IGGLSGVLLANVPPGKANYLQRAGRAGRRADGSSVAVTYARPRPYDQAIFADLGDYLAKPLRRPVVLLKRERVVRRHFHALLLNSFFQAIMPPGIHVGAMRAYGLMGGFCGVGKPGRWEGRNAAKPVLTTPDTWLLAASPPTWWHEGGTVRENFLHYLASIRDAGAAEVRHAAGRLLAGTICEGDLAVWPALIVAAEQCFTEEVGTWITDYDNLLAAWEATTEPSQANQANAIRYQIEAICETTVIETLADRQFLPRYGFPIDLQKLKVISKDDKRPGRSREEDQYRLQRSSLLAIGEYVPGSQLLAGGKLVTSHGLLKHWTGAALDKAFGLRGQCTTCVNGHFFYDISSSLTMCPICKEGPNSSSRDLLFPKHGFTSAAWDPPKWSTDVDRVGRVQTASITFTQSSTENDANREISNFAGLPGVRARYREDGEILVYNSGDYDKGFAICIACGYAESERKVSDNAADLPSSFKSHAPIYSTNIKLRCRKEGAGTLRNQILAAHETTDVLLVDVSEAIGEQADRAVITTLGYALQRAGAEILELDSREIAVLAVPAGPEGRYWGVMLYDNVPGGAGHVAELLSEGDPEAARGWLETARKVMYVNEEHHEHCETACVRCLLAYDAQFAMSDGLLQRCKAFTILDQLLAGGPISQPAALPRPALGQPYVPRLSNEERLRRAAQRQSGKR